MIFKGEVMKRITSKKPKVSYLRSSILLLSALGLTTSLAVASDFSGQESYKPPVTQYRPSVNEAPYSEPVQKRPSQIRQYVRPYGYAYPYGFAYVQRPMRFMFQPRGYVYPFGGYPPFFGGLGGHYQRLIPINAYGFARPYISEQNEQSRDKPLK
jgi:hypothetical protein